MIMKGLFTLLALFSLVFFATGSVNSTDASIFQSFFEGLVLSGNAQFNFAQDLCIQSGITCDVNGHINSIALPGSLLQGTISTSLGELVALQALNLSSNSLTGTIPTQLGNILTLVTLDLSYNSLYGTVPTTFGKLTNLEYLSLNNNQLTGTLPSSLEIPGLLSLNLEGNNICPLSNYSSWANFNDFPGSTTCNACTYYSCRNGGTCSSASGSLNCTCRTGFTGENCEIVNYCATSNCTNNSTCVNSPTGSSCSCLSGYTGARCEIYSASCTSNPCLNNATCFNGLNSFLCVCKSGYNGTTCQNDISLCASNPCLNGATCVNGVNKFTCTCAKDYNGTLCAQRLPACVPNPCLNGGTCTEGVNATEYNCTCTWNFNGTTCNSQISKVPVTSISVTGGWTILNLNFTYYNSSSSIQASFKSDFRSFFNQTFSVVPDNIILTIGKATTSNSSIQTNFSLVVNTWDQASALSFSLYNFVINANSTSLSPLKTLLGSKYLVNATAPLHFDPKAVNTTMVVGPQQISDAAAKGLAFLLIVFTFACIALGVYIQHRVDARKAAKK